VKPAAPSHGDQQRVLRYLEERAVLVKIDDLAGALGMPRRTVERSIEELRLAGAPLISSSGKPAGIRFSRDPSELRACVDRLRQRAANQFVTARRLRDTADQLAAERVARGPVEQTALWGQEGAQG
jgi:hypothetical protein